MNVELKTQKSLPLPERGADGAVVRKLNQTLKTFGETLQRKRTESPAAPPPPAQGDKPSGGTFTRGIRPGGVDPLKNARPSTDPADEKQLREACQGFESMFLTYMLAQMRKVSFASNNSADSFGKEQYQDMFDQELTKAMAKRGVGLGDMLYRQLTHDPQKVYRPPAQDKLKLIK